MKQSLIELLSGADNSTLELFRFLAVLAILVAFGLEIYAVLTGKTFDIQAYGIGIGGVLVAAGGALRLKDGPPKE